MISPASTVVRSWSPGAVITNATTTSLEELVLLADDGDLAARRARATIRSSTSLAETFSPPTFSRSLSRSW